MFSSTEKFDSDKLNEGEVSPFAPARPARSGDGSSATPSAGAPPPQRPRPRKLAEPRSGTNSKHEIRISKSLRAFGSIYDPVGKSRRPKFRYPGIPLIGRNPPKESFGQERDKFKNRKPQCSKLEKQFPIFLSFDIRACFEFRALCFGFQA